MIYIVGVDHQVQHNRNLKQTKEFVNFIGELVHTKNAEVLAEEWSEDANTMNNIATSVLEDIACMEAIEYIACDPTISERQELGIRTRDDIAKETRELYNQHGYSEDISKEYRQKLAVEDHPKREQFWYEQIKNHRDKDIIFVCGSEHISKFTKLRSFGFDLLLEQHKIPYEIVSERFDFK